jgi:hypothetical protein
MASFTTNTFSATAHPVDSGSGIPFLFWTIGNPGTGAVYITRVAISATQTTTGYVDIFLNKYSSMPTGGSFTASLIVPHDSRNSGAPAAVTGRYTSTGPTPGTFVGGLRLEKMFVPATSIAGNFPTQWTFGLSNVTGENHATQITLAPNECLTLETPSGFGSGASVDIFVEWLEKLL